MDIGEEISIPLDVGCQNAVLWEVQPLFTQRAQAEVEEYSGSQPAHLKPLLDAFLVENVPACAPDARGSR